MNDAARQATARAHANIALAKYWGKVDARLNIPAVPSISLTLDCLTTETEVRFDPDLRQDQIWIDGKRLTDEDATRASACLDLVRRTARLKDRARVRSHNDFPTAAGLASSASGFAALVTAAAGAADLPHKPKQLSAWARRISASAARSLYGGFAELPAGERGQASLCARSVAAADHWPVRLVIALTAEGRKTVGSTEGMERSRKTSPFHAEWVAKAPKWAREVKAGIKSRDLSKVGAAMEASTLAFHSIALTANPPIVYWKPATLAALATVHELRATGVPVWATMDAGPHVKALCEPSHAARVQRALDKTPGVLRTLVAKPGPGAELIG